MKYIFIFAIIFSGYSQTNCASYIYNGKNARLYFNDTTSLFIHHKIQYEKKIVRQRLTMTANNVSSFQISRMDSIGAQEYRNFNQKVLKERYATHSSYLKAWTVEDIWQTINWDIKKKKKKIRGYTCYKAVGNYRGRTYTVWFTYEIKVPYGPWKLFGLPGLILEANDQEGRMDIDFVEIMDKCDSSIKPPQEGVHRSLREHVNYKDSLGYYLFASMQGKAEEYYKKKGEKPALLFRYTPKQTAIERRETWPERTFPWETDSPYRKQKNLGLDSKSIKD